LQIELVEAHERVVEVSIVEHLATIDSISLDRQKGDLSPFCVEALR